MRNTIVFGAVIVFLMGTSCELPEFKPSSVSMQNHSWSVDSLSRLKTGLTGYMDSSLLGNHQAISVDMNTQELVLSLPAPNLFQNWVRSIPQLPGVTLKATVNSLDQSLLLLRYPLYLLVAKFDNFGDQSGLPNGQGLPGVPGGKAHNVKLVLDQYHQTHIFFDKGIVGLLLDVPYDPMLATTIPIKDSLLPSNSGNILGYANTIPKDSFQYGGLLLTTIIPASALQILEHE